MDAADRIVDVSGSWDRFAAANEAPALTSASVRGQSLWEFVAGPETREVWKSLLSRVRSEAGVVRLPFRCDAPAVRRFLTIEISAGEQGVVEVSTRLVREERRRPVRLLDPVTERTEELLRICSWCKRVETPRGWSEVEEAVEQLDLFGRERVPEISHGMCPPCLERVSGGL